MNNSNLIHVSPYPVYCDPQADAETRARANSFAAALSDTHKLLRCDVENQPHPAPAFLRGTSSEALSAASNLTRLKNINAQQRPLSQAQQNAQKASALFADTTLNQALTNICKEYGPASDPRKRARDLTPQSIQDIQKKLALTLSDSQVALTADFLSATKVVSKGLAIEFDHVHAFATALAHSLKHSDTMPPESLPKLERFSELVIASFGNWLKVLTNDGPGQFVAGPSLVDLAKLQEMIVEANSRLELLQTAMARRATD